MKIKREYRLSLEMGKKTRVFTFSQASAYETIKFAEEVQQEGFNIVFWAFQFLNEKCKLEKPRWFGRKNITEREYAKCVNGLPVLIETIRKSYFRGAFSDNPDEETVNNEDGMPLDAYYALLAEKLCIDPLRMLHEYTFEQINEMGKGVVYVMNMQTEEGQKRNKRAKMAEKFKAHDKDKIREALAQLEEWKKQNT